MQPYFFPYIGYFQLINLVEQFVLHDDVQWIKGGWINRNRILLHGKPSYITLPVEKASSLLMINQRFLTVDSEAGKEKILLQLKGTYSNAPFYHNVIDVVSECFAFRSRNISEFVTNSLRICCDYLGLNTRFIYSSELFKNNILRGEDRVLEISRILGSTHYINPIGGVKLYDKNRFEESGIRLNFIKPQNITYKQSGQHEFLPNLSIIDVMMFNSETDIKQLLEKYDLV